MPNDPREEIKPGDWVVWSDYRDAESEHFMNMYGRGPFQVREVGSNGNLYLNFPGYRAFIQYYFARFRKDIFVNAVKEAIASADPEIL